MYPPPFATLVFAHLILIERLGCLNPYIPDHPDTPVTPVGYRDIIIEPVLSSMLTSAEASLHSVYGPVRSSWKIAEGTLTLEVTIPVNTRARIVVPASGVKEGGKPVAERNDMTLMESSSGRTVIEAGSGEYLFTGKI